MCRELVAKFLNMFINSMRFSFAKILRKTVARLSCDGRATVVRRTCEYRGPVAAKFWQHSYKCRASVVRRSRDSLEKTCEHLATIWRENKTKRHSYECRATLSRMSRDCRTNENENKLDSWESHETPSRMSRDCRATVATVARLSRESCEIYFQN